MNISQIMKVFVVKIIQIETLAPTLFLRGLGVDRPCSLEEALIVFAGTNFRGFRGFKWKSRIMIRKNKYPGEVFIISFLIANISIKTRPF